jgi:hypothetical protein
MQSHLKLEGQYEFPDTPIGISKNSLHTFKYLIVQHNITHYDGSPKLDKELPEQGAFHAPHSCQQLAPPVQISS